MVSIDQLCEQRKSYDLSDHAMEWGRRRFEKTVSEKRMNKPRRIFVIPYQLIPDSIDHFQSKEMKLTGTDPDQVGIKVTAHHYEYNQKESFFFHTHDYFELVYVHRGQAYNQFSNCEITLRQGDVLLLSPNIPHCLSVESPDDSVFNIVLSKKVLRESFITRLSGNSPVTQFFVDYFLNVNQTQEYMLFQTDPQHDSSPILIALIEEFCNKGMGWEKAVESYMSLVFTILTRSYRSKMPQDLLESQQMTKIVNILSYIHDHIDMVTLASTAQHFNYSTTHVLRLIKQHTGKTFNAVLTNFRMDYARELLANSKTSIEDITQLVGYNDVSYFYRVFKKIYMQSPSQYRKAIQKELNGQDA